MIVSLIITGTGKWDEYTRPFISSIIEYAPEFHVVCVDNGSTYSVNPSADNIQMVRLPEIQPYPAVLNEGIKAFKADWYFLCNNDMLLTKRFPIERMNDLRDDSLYSWVMVSAKTVGFEYLESFSMFVPHRIVEAIGYFDENFRPMWFEGSDYCYRAQRAGFFLAEPLDRTEWGVYHLEDERDGERREYMREHIEERRANRLYLWKKHHLFGY